MTLIFKFFKNVFSNDKETHEVPVSNDVHEILAQNRERILRNRTEREEREKAKRKAKESAAGASSSVTGGDSLADVPSLAALSSPYDPWKRQTAFLDEYELDEDTPEPGDDDYVEPVEEGASEGEECSVDDDRDEACVDSGDSGSDSGSSSDDSYSSSYDFLAPPMSLPTRALLTRPLATITRNPALATHRRLTIRVLPTLTIVEALILAPLATN